MQTVATDEYSLWLEPDPAQAQEFQNLIKDFARRARTPVFKPHLTLLPGLHGEEQMLVEKLSQLAYGGTCVVKIGKVCEGSAYHKCLYFVCELSEQLVTMRKKSETIFSTTQPFHPHISLAYGLDEPFRGLFMSELEGKQLAFTVTSLSLWHAKGTPDEWRKVAAAPLV